MSVPLIISEAAKGKNNQNCNASTHMSLDAAVLRFRDAAIQSIRGRMYVGSAHNIGSSEMFRCC